jgi:hypothetical protein
LIAAVAINAPRTLVFTACANASTALAHPSDCASCSGTYQALAEKSICEKRAVRQRALKLQASFAPHTLSDSGQ